ncbi:MAG TPA: hypothetical protein DEA73_05485 [Peptococcaceae bacterium]|nr:MAG: hypothetical protein XD51_0971 [Moorella sp. 60_41]HBT47314.1 hypothetical protein [Peptococcaceae bacterium]
MARAVMAWESGEPGRAVLSPKELNEAYARLEERYNSLRSNWEWFVKEDGRADRTAAVVRRVDQN